MKVHSKGKEIYRLLDSCLTQVYEYDPGVGNTIVVENPLLLVENRYPNEDEGHKGKYKIWLAGSHTFRLTTIGSVELFVLSLMDFQSKVSSPNFWNQLKKDNHEKPKQAAVEKCSKGHNSRVLG